jgi:pimeloyl-ACP methyl ester carboxylesterase
VHLVCGGRSDRWSPAERGHVDEAVAARVVVDHVVDHAGHWVHTDDPQGLLSIMLASLPTT